MAISTKLYQDQLLTNIAKGYRPVGHINGIILPNMPVVKPTGQIAVFDASNIRLVTTIKSPEGGTPSVTSRPTKADAYVLEEHSLKAMASDKDAENFDSPFDIQRDKTELVQDLLSIGREYACASFMSDTAQITQNATLSGTSQWSDYTNSDPISDLVTAVGTVADRASVPDELVSLVLPTVVLRKLKRHPKILDSLGFKYNQAQQMTNEQLAAALGVKEIINPYGIYNSAADGQADVIAKMWGKHAWAIYIAPSPKLKQLTFGYTMTRKSGPIVDKQYDWDVRGWWVRNTDEWDQYVLDDKCAYLVKNAVA